MKVLGRKLKEPFIPLGDSQDFVRAGSELDVDGRAGALRFEPQLVSVSIGEVLDLTTGQKVGSAVLRVLAAEVHAFGADHHLNAGAGCETFARFIHHEPRTIYLDR